VNSNLLDATTALLHHVENTRKCGNNLQRLRDIDLEPFWSAKLDTQVRKAIRLANSLNHLINSEPTTGDSESFNIYSSTAQKQQEAHSSLNYYTKIIDSTFLSSLSHFIFSSSSLNGQDTSSLLSVNAKKTFFANSESTESASGQIKENMESLTAAFAALQANSVQRQLDVQANTESVVLASTQKMMEGFADRWFSDIRRELGTFGSQQQESVSQLTQSLDSRLNSMEQRIETIGVTSSEEIRVLSNQLS
jgi:hypothetical protein